MSILPNEILNLIFSFKEINPVCKIMKENINEYNDMKIKRTRKNCYYFHSIIRYKIDQILKFRQIIKKNIDYGMDNPYEAIEDELWMMDYFDGDYDASILYTEIKSKITFKNMDFNMGYRQVQVEKTVELQFV